MTGSAPPPPYAPAPSGDEEPGIRGPMVAVLLAYALAIALTLVVASAASYLPLVDDVREMRAAAQRLSNDAADLEPADLDRATLDRLTQHLAVLEKHLEPIAAAMDDPIVGLARNIEPAAVQIEAAEALLDAAGALVEVGDIGLGMADEVVTMRERNEADPDFELTAGLVELIATSTADVDRMDVLIESAQQSLDEIPADAADQILEARDLVAEPLDTYRPLLDQYRELDEIVPELMGWGEQKQYLVLAQNPAELRPAGGYAGTVGLITVEDGRLAEQRFVNVYDLDLRKDLPFVEPPEELTELLLGPNADGSPQSWRLADAAWSPDFPIGAEKSAEFYALQTDGIEVDGVIAITTYAIDRLLEVVGPVDVPAYDVTVEPGDVTFTLLGETREGEDGTLRGRKDILDVLARTLMQRLLSLPPEQWGEMIEALEDIGSERMALAWMVDETAQELIVENGWSGEVRDDAGDYVYVVESNVAPTSKYNLVVDRSDSMVVKLDEAGDALNSLRLDWQNDAFAEGERYDLIREYSQSVEEGLYGAYVRTLVPEGSELITASGKSLVPANDVDRTTVEAGRLAYGNYLLMEPGESSLSYLWTVPDAAVETDEGWEYSLVVQKQPGARTFPVSVRIDLPEGATVIETSAGMEVDGERVRYETDMDTDIELRVRYELASDA